MGTPPKGPGGFADSPATPYEPIATHAVDFKHIHVPPPGALYIGRNIRLHVRALALQLGFSCPVRLRILLPTGEVVSSVHSVAIGGSASPQDFFFEEAEGFLLDVTVGPASVAARRGDTFVQVSLAQGTATNFDDFALLVSDYVTDSTLLGWPNTFLRNQVDGDGSIVANSQGAPLAGADFAVTVSNPNVWRLKTFTASLTTAIAVANREVRLTIEDNAGSVFSVVTAAFTQVASLTFAYSWNLGVQRLAGTQFNVISLPLPEVRVRSLFVIRTVTTNLQAADQWSSAIYLIERYQGN